MAKRRAELRVGLEHGRIAFEKELLRRHRELKTKLSSYLWNARPLVILTAPFIYALIVPLLMLDLFVSIYQMICFPVYGIPKVKRGDYFVFDRHHLAYLNALEKLNCAYCSYANCLIVMCARSPGGPSNIGARSSTHGGWSERIRVTSCSMITVMPKIIRDGWPNYGKI